MTIKKQGDKFQLVSATGKNLGTFNTREEAVKREKQVQGFKKTKKSDGTTFTVLEAKAYRADLLANAHKHFDMSNPDVSERAACMVIAMEEIQREDRLLEIARSQGKSLEQIMADAKPSLDDGTPVDLASGSATTEMLVINRVRSGETGNAKTSDLTGNTNEHEHQYNPSIAGFTGPDGHDGHVHWVDIRMASTLPGGTAYHIHSTQPFEVQRDDLIHFEEKTSRSDFGGLELGSHEPEAAITDFNGLFTGVERASPYGNDPKKKKKTTDRGESATPGGPASYLPPTSRNRGDNLKGLVYRESRERDDTPKKRRITGQERLFGNLDPDAQDVALLPPDKQ